MCEAAVCVGSAFKHRFPLTTQLARVALKAVAPFVFDGQVQQQPQPPQQPQQQQQSNSSSRGMTMLRTKGGRHSTIHRMEG